MRICLYTYTTGVFHSIINAQRRHEWWKDVPLFYWAVKLWTLSRTPGWYSSSPERERGRHRQTLQMKAYRFVIGEHVGSSDITSFITGFKQKQKQRFPFISSRQSGNPLPLKTFTDLQFIWCGASEVTWFLLHNTTLQVPQNKQRLCNWSSSPLFGRGVKFKTWKTKTWCELHCRVQLNWCEAFFNLELDSL